MENSDKFICAPLGKPFTSNCSWRKATGNYLYSSALPKSTRGRQKWQCHHGPALGQSTHHHHQLTTMCSSNLITKCSSNLTTMCFSNLTTMCSSNLTTMCSSNLTTMCSSNLTTM